jgi:adenylate cyclase
VLEELSRQGASAEEIAEAAAADRLVLLPAELALGGRGGHTLAEVARQAGLEEGFLRAYGLAMGLPVARGDPPIAGEDDVEAARILARAIQAGLPPDGLLEVARISGQWLPVLSQALVRLVGGTFLRPGDTELDVALRYRAIAEELRPLLGRIIDHHLTQHLRQAIRSEVLSHVQVAAGSVPKVDEVAVAFADLSGFTRLGTRVPADEMGRVAGRLAALTTETVAPPVQVVKFLGDAAMLVSTDPAALLHALLRLLEAVDAERGDLPRLHAGAALGGAVARAGDWFGHAVNLSSRITAVARPGTVVGDAALRVATGDAMRWSRLPRRHLRGLPGTVALYRLRGPLGEQAPDRPGL